MLWYIHYSRQVTYLCLVSGAARCLRFEPALGYRHVCHVCIGGSAERDEAYASNATHKAHSQMAPHMLSRHAVPSDILHAAVLPPAGGGACA